METSVEAIDQNVAVMRLLGRLDFVTAAEARKAFADAVGAGQKRLVVDLAAVDFVDSSGLGALIGGLKTARQAGGDLRIACATTQAQTVLALTSLDRVFRLYPSVGEALADYQG